MAIFKVETKNKVDVDKKPRVYFTCHPDDLEKCFKKVCDDIFKTHDCAIYYTEDMTEVIAEDVKTVDLGRNNLFVIPVTYKLLTTPNRAMDADIPYALKEHIPVLPIMMEPGIDEFYSKPDKFGELQYLNPYSTDLTEISYEEKLKKYLESVLISDELAKRVRAAFDTYIFLSYRKKDRKYANELMRLIHSIPECRDIAIWFDEFLTPGESFKENIEKILDDCNLFTLLVTPQLLEKVVDENGEERDNYVISTELPLARKKKEEKGTDIFAVEMEKTDRDALATIDIENYVSSGDSEFRARLLDAVSRMAITTNDTPEHNFLIGLAYLEGIDMEVDHKCGIDLITSAAESDLVVAIRKLIQIYQYGEGVSIDSRKVEAYSNKLIDILKMQFFKNTTLDNFIELADELNSFGEYEKGYAKFDSANNLFKGINEAALKVTDKSVAATEKVASYCLMAYVQSAKIHLETNGFSEAEVYVKRALSMADKANKMDALVARNISSAYIVYGDICKMKTMFPKAREMYAKAYDMRIHLVDENSYGSLRDIAFVLDKMCVVDIALKDFESALRHIDMSEKWLKDLEELNDTTDFQNMMCDHLLTKVKYYLTMNMNRTALNVAKKAEIKLLDVLKKQNSIFNYQKLYSLYKLMGEAVIDTDKASGIEYYLTSLSYIKRAADNTKIKIDKCFVLYNIAKHVGDDQAKITYYKELVQEIEWIGHTENVLFENSIPYIYFDFATVCKRLNDKEYIIYFKKVVHLMNQRDILCLLEPEKNMYWMSCFELGNAFYVNNDIARAQKYFETGLFVKELLITEKPTILRCRD